ncbi:hypothetical protein C8R44DRAFT_851345 [Mycena epipterygia]|nr:hypothetical protein C8R44DRAFT_851345 [Mycena epipterygia]
MQSSVLLVLCFLSFILGQLFSAYCTSLANVKIPVVTPQVVVSEYSLQALLAIVLSVLVVHDLVLVLLLRHLLSSPTPTPKGILKLLNTVAHGVDVHTDNLAVVLFSRLNIGNSRAGYRKVSTLLPSRPAIVFPFFLGATLSVTECCTALFLFVKRDARPLFLFSILARARVAIPPWVHSFPAHLRHLAPAISSNHQGAHLKKIAAKEYEEPVPVLVPPAQVPVHSQDGIPARPSHAPLLRHLVAAAILRKCRVRIVIEEDCHAGIEEVEEVDDLSDTLVVEEEKDEDGEKLDEQVEVTVNQDTLVLEEEEEKVEEEQEEQFEEDSIEEQIGELTIDLESVAPSYQEFDLDAAPSYEEFANDAPPEPLFQKRTVAPLDHVIHRPPSLAAIAARMSASLPSTHARVSRLHLLARLSSRVSATSAEPISA